jgi:hypothetical protein
MQRWTARPKAGLDDQQKYFRYFSKAAARRHVNRARRIVPSEVQSRRARIMSQLVTAFYVGIVATVLVCSNALMPTPAGAAPMSDADKAALKQATATCRAQVKEQARFEEMSWYARHELVKKCVNETLAKSQ